MFTITSLGARQLVTDEASSRNDVNVEYSEFSRGILVRGSWGYALYYNGGFRDHNEYVDLEIPPEIQDYSASTMSNGNTVELSSVINYKGQQVLIATIFDQDGAQIGEPTVVAKALDWIFNPKIIPLGVDGFAVIWGDSQWTNMTMYSQSFSSSGVPIGERVTLRDGSLDIIGAASVDHDGYDFIYTDSNGYGVVYSEMNGEIYIEFANAVLSNELTGKTDTARGTDASETLRAFLITPGDRLIGGGGTDTLQLTRV